MAKLSLPDIASLANQGSALQAINERFAEIEAALDNTLSRDGTVPNHMAADLDLNSNKLLNVADPVDEADGVNLRSIRTLMEQFLGQIAETILEGTLRVDTFEATASQTEFELTDSPGTVENVEVFDNGLAMIPGVDYTLTGDAMKTVEFFVGRTAGHDIVARYTLLSPADSLLRSDLVNAAATKGAALVTYKHNEGTVSRSSKSKHDDSISILDFGADPTGVLDSAPAFRACVASNRTVKVPKGTYLLNSTLGSISGVATAPCVPIDGKHHFELIGESGAKLVMGPTMALLNNNFFTMYVSAASEAGGNYSHHNRISGLHLQYTRDVSVVGNVSGIQMSSTEDSQVDNCYFDATTGVSGNTLGLVGTGGKHNHYHHNKFKDISTCHDQSQQENCVWSHNKLYGTSGVTGFNYFYDAISIANQMRLEEPMAQVIGSGCQFVHNEVRGYGTAFSIRGMRDFIISDNVIHNFTANDATTRNAISIYTEADEYALIPAQWTRGVLIARNVIHNITNSGAGTTRAIFVNQFGGARPVTNIRILNNTIHDMAGEIGISFDGTADDWQVEGNIIDATTVGTPYGRETIATSVGAGAGNSPMVTVTGDIDLILKAGATRFVRFGTRVASGDVPVTGYIEIRDEGGTNRRLALVG